VRFEGFAPHRAARALAKVKGSSAKFPDTGSVAKSRVRCSSWLVKPAPVRPLRAVVFAGACLARAAMSRSELLFWGAALAIFVFSGIVVVVTSHNRHSRGGYITPSVVEVA
jgi:hypothetical protein